MANDAAAVAAALPGYEIGPELGRGGFGVVYAAKQRHLGRRVAIKQLPSVFANDAEIKDRFLLEARVLGSLDHPHIVPIYDYVEQDGLCLLVMECLTAGSVWDTFTTKGLNPAQACVMVIAAAAGLHHAHVNGVLHRDVKPENLLLNENNHLKVTDFGIAKMIGGVDAVATTDGGILGTPAYMAPEQADGSALGPTADVYAAGVMLYEMLSGTLPFSQDGGGLAIVYRHLYDKPTPLTDVAPHIPRELADVVMRALERQPSDRYATAEEFAVAIGESAVDGFGDSWYQDSGLRVISSDSVMRTLTSGALRRSAAARGFAPLDATIGGEPFAYSPSPVEPSAPTVGGAPFGYSPSPAPDAPPTVGGAAFGYSPSPAPDAQPTVGGSPFAYSPPAAADSSPTVQGTGLPYGPGPSGAPADPPSPRPAPARPVPATSSPGTPSPVTQLREVRPSIIAHVVGVLPLDAPVEPLVPVRQLLDVPPVPKPKLLATAVLLVLLVVAAVVGLGGSGDHGGSLTGAVTVAGTDVSGGDAATADLGSGVPIVLADPPAGAVSVQLKLAVDGIPIGKSDPAPITGGKADIKIGSARRLVAGPVEGTLLVQDADGRTLADKHLELDPSGSGFTTISGIVVALLTLFVLAYLESLIRPLWRQGRWRVQAGAGLGLVGAGAGIVLSLLAWTLGLHTADVLTAVVCAVLGGATAVLAGLTVAAWGRHARIKRINKRALAAPQPAGVR